MPQADPDLAVTLHPHASGPCLISVSGELDCHTAPRLLAQLTSCHPASAGSVAAAAPGN